jgi:predicted CopG family antitoxin
LALANDQLTAATCDVHIAQSMSTKTISLKREAYERLKAARRYPAESFSEVVLRARWAEDTITNGELLTRHRKGGHFSADELSRMEAARASDRAPEDKWAGR